jgi:solute carrier family 25 carnitine/acylcarnitine transporter 20/29
MGIEAELEKPEVGFKRTLKDLFSGAVGGVAQVLLGKCSPSS